MEYYTDINPNRQTGQRNLNKQLPNSQCLLLFQSASDIKIHPLYKQRKNSLKQKPDDLPVFSVIYISLKINSFA